MAIDKKKILNFISNFSDIVKKENWISRYDADNDSFAMRIPTLSRNARKRYVNEEFAFYVNDNNDVEGVFIEYFVSNFISHHKDFKNVAKEIKSQKKEEGLVELKKSETNKIAPGLEAVIIDSFVFDTPEIQKTK
ncbi:MAG: hypothetical protein AAB482_00805 [Patescibacteria group bacterium]